MILSLRYSLDSQLRQPKRPIFPVPELVDHFRELLHECKGIAGTLLDFRLKASPHQLHQWLWHMARESVASHISPKKINHRLAGHVEVGLMRRHFASKDFGWIPISPPVNDRGELGISLGGPLYSVRPADVKRFVCQRIHQNVIWHNRPMDNPQHIRCERLPQYSPKNPSRIFRRKSSRKSVFDFSKRDKPWLVLIEVHPVLLVPSFGQNDRIKELGQKRENTLQSRRLTGLRQQVGFTDQVGIQRGVSRDLRKDFCPIRRFTQVDVREVAFPIRIDIELVRYRTSRDGHLGIRRPTPRRNEAVVVHPSLERILRPPVEGRQFGKHRCSESHFRSTHPVRVSHLGEDSVLLLEHSLLRLSVHSRK